MLAFTTATDDYPIRHYFDARINYWPATPARQDGRSQRRHVATDAGSANRRTSGYYWRDSAKAVFNNWLGKVYQIAMKTGACRSWTSRSQQSHWFMNMQRIFDMRCLARQNVADGGGPFGAIVVKDQRIIASSANRVTPNLDPLSHAEIMAIRLACQQTGDFQLPDCTLYTSCEPCPMCRANLWARLKDVYYACNPSMLPLPVSTIVSSTTRFPETGPAQYRDALSQAPQGRFPV